MFFYFSYQLSTLRLLSFGSDETSYSIAAYPIDTPSARTVLIEGTFSGDEFDLYGLDRLIRDNLSEPGIHLLEIVGALFQGRESILFFIPAAVPCAAGIGSLLRMNRFSIDYTPTSYYTPITVAFVSNDDVHASQSVTAEVYLSFGNERTKTSFCVPGVKKNGLWIFTYDPREVLEDYPRLSSRGTWRASISFNPFEKDGIEAFTHPRRNTINLICEPLVEGSRIVYYKDAFNLPAYLRLDNLTVVTTPKITKGVIGTQRVNVETEIETKYEYESEPLCREKLNDFLALSISRDIRFDSPKGERLVILECELKETEGFHKRPTVKLVITPAATSPSFGEGEPHNLFNSPFSTVFD